MGWEKGGRYYTRSKRANGRVVREYVGGGEAGEAAAREDAAERDRREAVRQLVRAERDQLGELDALVGELVRLADLVARAALLAAGYRQHDRGQWRKQRVRQAEAD
jgi:hypothetical protein